MTVSLAAASSLEADFDDCWYQDRGATQHMSSRKEWFKNYVVLDCPSKVIIDNATELKGIGEGDVELEAFNAKTWRKTVLKDVLYTPKMPFNLFSVSSVLDKGYKQSADADKSLFKDSNGIIGAIALREEKLFKMKFRQEPEKCLVNNFVRKWHEKLACQNVAQVREVLNKSGIEFLDDWDDYVSPGFTYGKQHRVSHSPNPKISVEPLDLVHADLCEINV